MNPLLDSRADFKKNLHLLNLTRFFCFISFQAWSSLFDLATSKIEIVSYHWGLQRGSGAGQQVYDSLAKAVTDRKVHLSIIHTTNKTEDERYDTMDLLRLAPDLGNKLKLLIPNV